MKQLISTLIIIIWLSAGANAQKQDERLAGFDTEVSKILKEWNVPGISVSVVEKSNVILAKSYGFKDYESKKAATENTLFGIGSCTKAFTAALLSTAIKDGKIDLDKPVNNYLSELKFSTAELTENVTLRDMLSHRTGMPRHDLAWHSGAFADRESMLYAIRFMEPVQPLRQSFQYNNYMYAAVAMVAEKLYKKNWETLVKERLFKPAGMIHSSTEGDVYSDDKDFSYGYVENEGKIKRLEFLPASVKAMAPAGGINSTAKDIAQWMLVWVNKGKLNGKEIISPEFYNQAISSQMIVSANLPSATLPDYHMLNYGLGWYTSSYRGHYGVAHGGNINGFSSFACFLSSDSIGIFITVNQNASAVPRIVTNLLLDRMIKATFRDWNKIYKTSRQSTQPIVPASGSSEKMTHPLQAYIGTYKNDAYGTIMVKLENGILSGNFNRWPLQIHHLRYNYFSFSIAEAGFQGNQSITGEFSIDENGIISALKMPFENGIKPIEFTKQIIQKLQQDSLQKYTGEYSFSGMTAIIYISVAGILKAKVPGQPEYELVYVKDHEFAVKSAKGVGIRFEVDEKGYVPSCIFIQPNGTMKVNRIVNAGIEPTKPIVVPDEAKSTLSKYTGEYDMSRQTVKIFIKEERLIALIPGQPEYVLELTGADEFSVTVAKNYKVKFDRNENGSISGFTLIQPGGSVTAVKK